MVCPEACKEDRKKLNDHVDKLFEVSISPTLRAITITLIGMCFMGLAGSFVYAVSTYATKEDLREQRMVQSETLSLLKAIDRRLSKGK